MVPLILTSSLVRIRKKKKVKEGLKLQEKSSLELSASTLKENNFGGERSRRQV